MKDFNDREVKVGDKVAFVFSTRGTLEKGEVVDIESNNQVVNIRYVYDARNNKTRVIRKNWLEIVLL